MGQNKTTTYPMNNKYCVTYCYSYFGFRKYIFSIFRERIKENIYFRTNVVRETILSLTFDLLGRKYYLHYLVHALDWPTDISFCMLMHFGEIWSVPNPNNFFVALTSTCDLFDRNLFWAILPLLSIIETWNLACWSISGRCVMVQHYVNVTLTFNHIHVIEVTYSIYYS